MQFILLLYGDETAELALAPEERRAIVERHMAFARELRDEGIFVGGDALDVSSSATVVRAGKATDGPFIETKEQLGGFYIVECPDREAAVALARRVPESPESAVEVRPIPSTEPSSCHNGRVPTPTRIHADREAGTLAITWDDDHETTYEAAPLRWLCPCAFCRGEAGLPGWLDSAPTLTAEQIRLVDIQLVGNYALAPAATATTPATTPTTCCVTTARARIAQRAGRRNMLCHRRHHAVHGRSSDRRIEGDGVRSRRPESRDRAT